MSQGAYGPCARHANGVTATGTPGVPNTKKGRARCKSRTRPIFYGERATGRVWHPVEHFKPFPGTTGVLAACEDEHTPAMVNGGTRARRSTRAAAQNRYANVGAAG